jgi:hypothetical protein
MIKIRLATDEYCYIEFDFEGSAEEALEEYSRIRNLKNGGFGVTTKEFNDAVDLYLTKNTGNLELYNKMSKEQQEWFQTTKKAMKRLEAHNNT